MPQRARNFQTAKTINMDIQDGQDYGKIYHPICWSESSQESVFQKKTCPLITLMDTKTKSSQPSAHSQQHPEFNYELRDAKKKTDTISHGLPGSDLRFKKFSHDHGIVIMHANFYGRL